jgi:hypothetical protein
MRRLQLLAVATGLVVGLAGSSVASAGTVAPAARAAFCGQVWGSLPEVAGDFTNAHPTNLRAGRHACFDRLVIDMGPTQPGPGDGPLGYDVRYVPQVVQDGSGEPVPLAGRAFLAIVLRTNAFDDAGTPTYAPADRLHAVNVSGFRTFRQVAFLGTFEGYTTIGLGVRARLPFRVFILPGPGAGSRLVIDVGHLW